MTIAIADRDGPSRSPRISRLIAEGGRAPLLSEGEDIGATGAEPAFAADQASSGGSIPLSRSSSFAFCVLRRPSAPSFSSAPRCLTNWMSS